MAAISVLKLVVDDKEYSASLKNAKQGMQALQDSLQNAGKTFLDVDKKVVEYARALGQMETTSKSARGKIGEMSSAFVELSIQYKHLTDQEKQSPLGKAMSESLDTLKTRVIDAKQELSDFENQLKNIGDVKINAAGGGLFGGLGDKMTGALQVFAGNMLTKAAGAALDFAGDIGECVKQGIELARQGEGIRIAFERLNKPGLLDNLREATHGTVTDLELMKAAVKFNDFKLPVEELGTMLAFAQQKAKDTGQSVDYMVESITNGLGRQSKPILDNLGISAKEIEERMKSTGDFTKAVGEIIRDKMKAAGDYIETAADRATQANVSLQNKMEELGRKFAPLEEASNNLWTSMKIGIMDIVGGPLTDFINKLTEAGRLANAYGVLGGTTKVGRMTKNLSSAKEENRQSIYQQQQEQFWRYINPREQQIQDIQRWQRGERGEALQSRISAITEKYGSLDATKIRAEVDAAKKMLADYQQAAKSILNPIAASTATTDGTTKTTGSSKTVKTEEQLNNENIQKLIREYQKLATAEKTASESQLKDIEARKSAIQTEIGKLQDRNKELARFASEAKGVNIYSDSLPGLTQQLKELQTAQAESANGEEWDNYQKKIEAVTDKINVLKGVLPKDQQATFTLDVNAEQLEQLRMLLPTEDQSIRINVEQGRVDLPKVPTDDETIKVNVEQGRVDLPKVPTDDETIKVNVEQGRVDLPKIPTNDETIKVNVEQGRVDLPKVPTDDETIKINVEQGQVNLPKVPTDDETIKVNVEQGRVDLPKVPTNDETIRVNITADTAEAMKAVRDYIDGVDGMTAEVSIKAKVDDTEVKEKLTAGEAMVQEIQLKLAEQNMEADMQTLRTLLETQIENGIEGVNIPTDELIEKIMGDGANIPDEYWQNLQDQINEKLAELKIEPIQIDFSTGSAKKQSKEMSKDWNAAAQAIQSVGSAMASIEDPAAKVVGTIAQAIASIALGYALATTQAAALGPFAWVAFAATGMAQMISMISSIHSATGYAEGGVIKGSSYSGDNMLGQINGGGPIVGLNAGEVILNRAQQGVIADAIGSNESGGGRYSPSHISGEQIYIVLNRYLKRTGRGEMVTWK